MARTLSPKRERILQFIGHFMEEHHFPPTVRDIQSGCNISSTSVVDYNLRKLQQEGYLRRFPDVSRGIELLNGGLASAAANVVSVPVVGSIAAGSPMPLPPSGSWRQEAVDSVDLPAFLTRSKKDVYAVRVKGDSMIDALVADGDLVILEPTARPENGDMVAARLIDTDEVTLKRFHMEGNKVRLQPANAGMKPIVVPADRVAVSGRVIGVVRSL